MATITSVESKILKQYSLNFLTIKTKRIIKKKNLMENLFEYMIKDNWNKKEDLAINIDPILYGNK